MSARFSDRERAEIKGFGFDLDSIGDASPEWLDSHMEIAKRFQRDARKHLADAYRDQTYADCCWDCWDDWPCMTIDALDGGDR